MSVWYFAKKGETIGPMSVNDAVIFAEENPNCLAWKKGFASWIPIKNLDELKPSKRDLSPALPHASGGICDEIDYKIYGDDMQFVEIELDPQETAVAEAGAMMYKDTDIRMDALFGDGSSGGVMSKLFSAGRRILTGESMFMTAFTHDGLSSKAKVGFGAPYPGKIIPVALPQIGGELVCQKDSFLCAAKGVSIGIHFQKRILTGLFGGEGFVMQKLEGDGMVFVHAGGTMLERELKAGEDMHIDTGCIVAYEPSVDFNIVTAGGLKSQLFGGEGVFLAHLQGPGKVWLQSLPFSRLAGRMLASVVTKRGQGGGSRRF